MRNFSQLVVVLLAGAVSGVFLGISISLFNTDFFFSPLLEDGPEFYMGLTTPSMLISFVLAFIMIVVFYKMAEKSNKKIEEAEKSKLVCNV